MGVWLYTDDGCDFGARIEREGISCEIAGSIHDALHARKQQGERLVVYMEVRYPQLPRIAGTWGRLDDICRIH